MLLRASVVGLCVSTQWNKLEIIIDKEGHQYVRVRFAVREREIRRSPVSPHQPGGEGGQQCPSPHGGAAGLPEGQHEEGMGEHDSLSHNVSGALQQGGVLH